MASSRASLSHVAKSEFASAHAATAPMKVSLFGLLIFLFCCAGVYYASQFAVVSNLDGNSDIERRRFLAASDLTLPMRRRRVAARAWSRRCAK